MAVQRSPSPTFTHLYIHMQDSASAAALWNSASHNSDHLNKVTQNGYRVYAILKVGVALAYPSGTVLELKKRICLKVYRKKNNNLVRSISSVSPIYYDLF